jgi:hypothetical protein
MIITKFIRRLLILLSPSIKRKALIPEYYWLNYNNLPQIYSLLLKEGWGGSGKMFINFSYQITKNI